MDQNSKLAFSGFLKQRNFEVTVDGERYEVRPEGNDSQNVLKDKWVAVNKSTRQVYEIKKETKEDLFIQYLVITGYKKEAENLQEELERKINETEN